MKKIQNPKIQFIRGIAIFLVIAIHSSASGVAGVLTRPFIVSAVPIFIFLSGYLTDVSKVINWRGFFKKRLSKILIPYLIWSVVYIVLSGNFDHVAFRVLTASSSVPMYYIFVYCSFVLLTPAIAWLMKSRYRAFGFVITPVGILLTKYIPLFLGVELEFWWNSFFFFNWFVFYYIGILLGNKCIRIDSKWEKKLLFFLGGAITLSMIEGLFWNYLDEYSMAMTALKYTAILSSCVVLCIAYLYINNGKQEGKGWFYKLFILLGDLSFGIYFGHMAIISVLNKVGALEFLPFPIGSVVILLGTLVCAMVGKKILGERFSYLLGL